MNLKNWKPIAGACAIFILGMVSGSAITAGIIQNKVKRTFLSGPKAFSERILKRLDRKLELDPMQRNRVREIILDGEKRAATIRHEIHPRFEEILVDSESKLRSILRPEQQVAFDKLVAERKLLLIKFGR